MRHARIALAVVVLVLGCAKKDLSTPPAPALDPAPATTELPAVVLTGSAQYLSKVSVTRTPPFGSGTDAQPAPVVADTYTARFRLAVPLEMGSNVFQVVAANLNGPSQPATVTIVRTAPAPTRLRATIPVETVSADTGTILVRAQVENDELTDLSGFHISFTATPGCGSCGSAVAPVTGKAVTDASGLAETTLSGLKTAGPWTLHVVSDDNIAASDTLPFAVVAGAPTQVRLSLSAQVNGTSASGASLSVPAGTSVGASTTVLDAEGNTVPALVALSTNAPGAFVSGARIEGLVRAGVWQVAAAVNEGSVPSATATLTVTPATPVSLAVSEVRAVAGDTLGLVLLDVFGNTVDPGGNTWAIAALACADPACASTTPDASAQATGSTVRVIRSGTEKLVAAVTGAGLAFSGTTTLQVFPAAPVKMALTVTPQAGTLSSVQAGTPIVLSAVVQDAFGNDTGLPVLLTTDAPGALIALPQLTGDTRAGGPFRIVAQAVGAPLSATQSFTVVPGPAVRLALQLASSGDADHAQRYVAQPIDAYGNVATDAVTVAATLNASAVALSGSNPGGAWTPDTGSNGQSGTVQIFGSGAAQILFTDPVSSLNGSAPLQITPGLPAAITIQSFTQPLASGATASFSYLVEDDHGNPVPGMQAVAITNAPGALLALDTGKMIGTLSGVTAAGSYPLIIESVAFGLTSAPFAFTVGAAPAKSLRFSLATTNVALGTPVPFQFLLVDANGNAVSPQPVSVAIALLPTPGNAPTIVQGSSGALNDSIAFNSIGTYTVQATVTQGGTSFSNASTVVDVYSGIDTTPPAVTLCVGTFSNATDPTSCVPAPTTYQPGDIVGVEVMAQDADGGGVAKVLLQARGVLSQDQSVLEATPNVGAVLENFRVQLPGNSPNGGLSLVGAAEDPSGNLGVSRAVLLSVSSNGGWGSGAGYTLQLLAGGPNSGLNRPWGLAVRQGFLYVANHGNQQIVKVDPNSSSGAVVTALDTANIGGRGYDPIDIIYNAGTAQPGLTDGFVFSTNQDKLLTWTAGTGPASVKIYDAGYGGYDGLNWLFGTGSLDSNFTLAENSNDQAHQLSFGSGPALRENRSGKWPAFSGSVTNRFGNSPSNLWDAVVANVGGNEMAYGTFGNNGGGGCPGSGGLFYYDLNSGSGRALDGQCGTFAGTSPGYVDTPRKVIFVDGSNGPAILYADNSPTRNNASVLRVPLDPNTLLCPASGCQAHIVATGLNAVGLAMIDARTLAVTDDSLNAVFLVTGAF